MNPVLLPVTDILKENIETLLLFRSKISTVNAKIDTQNKEIIKTVEIIEKFKACYNQQTEALNKFNDERSMLIEEYEALLQNVQNTSDEIKNHIKTEFDFIAENKLDESLNRDHETIDVDSQYVAVSNRNTSNDQNRTSVAVDDPVLDDTLTPNTGDAPRAATTVTKEVAKKKLKRKNSSTELLKPKSLKKKTKLLLENKKLKKKKKADSPNQEAIVMMKVDTCPIKKLASLHQHQHSTIHKISRINSDLFVCGSGGLLACLPKSGAIISYRGHDCRPVLDVYVHTGTSKCLVSLGLDSVFIHSASDPNNYRCLIRFESAICSSCVYKSKIYGCLGNGNVFIVDMATEKVSVMDKGSPSVLASIVVVKANGKKLLIGTAAAVSSSQDSGSDISAFGLDDKKIIVLQRPAPRPSAASSTAPPPLAWQGIITYSSSVLCYTRHAIFLLDIVQWSLSLVKEITNDIHFLDADMHNIVVLDNYNILHKYIIKKGKIKLGSSIEYLKSDEKTTAMCYNHSAKKIYFGMGSHLYNQNF